MRLHSTQQQVFPGKCTALLSFHVVQSSLHCSFRAAGLHRLVAGSVLSENSQRIPAKAPDITVPQTMAARSLQRSFVGVRMFLPVFPTTRAAIVPTAAKGMSTQAEDDMLFCRVHSAMVGSVETLKETSILQRALTSASSTSDEAKDDVSIMNRWHRVLGAMESVHKEAAGGCWRARVHKHDT